MLLSIVFFIGLDIFLLFSALVLFILKDAVIMSFGSFLAEWVCEFLIRCLHRNGLFV